MSNLIGRCIDLNAVINRKSMEMIEGLGLNYETENRMIMKMIDENFEELIELILNHDYEWRMSDDQRWWDRGYKSEQRIKELMKDYLWDDIEPFLKEDWIKERVMNMS